MSSSSNDRAEQDIVTVNTLKRDILLVNLALHNIHVRSSNFTIMGDLNSHSQSWGYNYIDARGEETEAWQDNSIPNLSTHKPVQIIKALIATG